jgi:hypothetical protein
MYLSDHQVKLRPSVSETHIHHLSFKGLFTTVVADIKKSMNDYGSHYANKQREFVSEPIIL